jgi:hypothetical protein
MQVEVSTSSRDVKVVGNFLPTRIITGGHLTLANKTLGINPYDLINML